MTSQHFSGVKAKWDEFWRDGYHNRRMSPDFAVELRDATTADAAFIVEMARHACIIEDWPLPDSDDEEVLSLLPPPGEVPIIAEDPTGVPVGAV